jgi:hypothetical protein
MNNLRTKKPGKFRGSINEPLSHNHKCHMRRQLFTCLLVATVLMSSVKVFCAEVTGNVPRLAVHGRLSFYNGTPSWRIWVVGTKRLLGVRQSGNEVPDVPKELLNLISPGKDVFADFTVEPLTPEEPGVMRLVRVVSASKLAVVESNKIVLKRAKL